MGSFNVSCGISSLSIDEDVEAGLVLLLPQRKIRSYDEGSLMKVGESTDYMAYLPPIYGKYNSYGGLGDIKPSPTVNLLERVFDRPIDVVMECLAGSRSFYGWGNPINEAYSTVKQTGNDYSRIRWLKGPDDGDSLTLLDYGFTQESVDDHEVRYRFGNSTIVYSMEKDIAIVHKTVMNEERDLGWIHAYHLSEVLEQFSGMTGLFPGFDKKHTYALKLLRKMSGMFFLPEVFKELAPTAMSSESYRQSWMERAERGWKEFSRDFMGDKGYFANSEDFRRTFFRMYDYPMDYYQQMFEAYQDDASDIMDGYTLFHTVNAANRMLEPSYAGSQHGEEDVEKKLAQISLKYVEKRRERWDD